MKHLNELLELYKTSCMIERSRLQNDCGSFYEDKKRVDSMLAQIRPFVFFTSKHTEVSFEEGDRIFAESFPFRVVSIESGITPSVFWSADLKILIKCVVGIEWSRDEFTYVFTMEGDDKHTPILKYTTKKDEHFYIVDGAFKHFMSTLRNKNIVAGRESCGCKIKISGGKFKNTLNIKNIINVYPKTYVKQNQEKLSHIDFSHRFEVMGHWRKIDTIGKDRNGNYNVSGFTWVSAHERGPEHLPLIKKTRIIHGPKDQANAGT